jgi:cytochrome c
MTRLVRVTLSGAIALSALLLSIGLPAADMAGHGGLIRSITVSADGRLVLTSSFDYTVRLWQFDLQQELRAFEAHEGPVNGAVFVPGQNRLLSIGADRALILWDLEDGRPLRTMIGHRGRGQSVAVTAKGDSAVTGGWDGRLVLWDLDEGRQTRVIETGVAVTAVAFGLGESVIVAGERDGAFRLWRRNDGISLGGIQAHDLGLTTLAASRDGRRLLSIGLDNAARIWDLDSLDLISEYLPEPEVKPLSAAIAPDGRSLLVGYIDGKVVHLDAARGAVLRSFEDPPGPVWAVAFSADGRFALTANAEERVKVWHLETGDRIDIADSTDGNRPTPWLESDHPGARVYRKCANCHALTTSEPQRSGPHFTGLFGRPAGAVGDYRYSSALGNSDLVWTRDTLSELFRQGPDRFLPGTKMPVQQITDEQALRDLIDYLAEIAPEG